MRSNYSVHKCLLLHCTSVSASYRKVCQQITKISKPTIIKVLLILFGIKYHNYLSFVHHIISLLTNTALNEETIHDSKFVFSLHYTRKMNLTFSMFLGVYTNEYCGREMQDLGGGERTTGFEMMDGVKTSAAPEICQDYPGTLRRSSMRECRDGGLNMNFMESYFCQVRLSATSFSPSVIFQASTDSPGMWQ